MTKSTQRPLAGYKVIDFGQYIAGPAVAMMLADQGADVIHIDPITGPKWDNPADAIFNRGKTRISLDLKNAEDLAQVKKLIENADVLIENFRPQVMSRLGLSAKQCLAINPALVYLSLPGFTHKDTDMSEIAATEGIIAAAVGQYTDMGLNRILMGINPSFSPLPLASAYASVLGATAVNLALFSRTKTGLGDHIEVPISAALMEGLAYNSMKVHGLLDRYKSPREIEIERRKKHNEPLNLAYTDLQEFLDPFYRTYQCKDDRPFYTVCSSHTRHPIACLEVLGIWDEIKAAGIPTHSAYLDQADWPKGTQCTVVSYPLSKEWAELVSTKMKAVFLTKTAYQWQQIFGEAKVPGCAHQTTQEWVNSEHALASKSILEIDDPRFGMMRQLGNICWLDGDDAIIEKQAAQPPCTCVTTSQERLKKTLNRWQKNPSSVPKPTEHKQQGWLEGINILDLTNVIAGPTIAATLSRFGAHVISIDPVVPALDPWNSTVFGMQANPGKESLLMDLKSPQGKEILAALLADIDVVTINASDDQLQRLGLSLAALHAINPRIILCQFDAYSGPIKGPRSDHSGYDDLVQATTGIMSRFGGSMQTPEEHAHFGTIDVLGGYCAAQAVAIALVKRARCGVGSLARSSLVAAGQLIQAPFMFDYETRSPFNEAKGREVKGANALYRCYQASDCWFFLSVNKAHQLQTFVDLIQTPTIDLSDDASAQQALVALFSSQPYAYWRNLLSPADISAQKLNSMQQLREQNLMHSDGDVDLNGNSSVAFIRHQNHPCGHTVDLIAPNAIRCLQSKVIAPKPMVKYGANTQQILATLGYTDQQIKALHQQAVVASSWSDNYLPS